jgi:hypothetical protein
MRRTGKVSTNTTAIIKIQTNLFTWNCYVDISEVNMNKKGFFILLLMAAIAIFGLSSCVSNQKLNNDFSPRSRFDWTGTYVGALPYAEERNNLYLRLNKDQSFEMTFEYLDRLEERICFFPGRFQWNEKGDIVLIDIIDAPIHYRVAENMLIRLDDYGRPLAINQGQVIALIKAN